MLACSIFSATSLAITSCQVMASVIIVLPIHFTDKKLILANCDSYIILSFVQLAFSLFCLKCYCLLMSF